MELRDTRLQVKRLMMHLTLDQLLCPTTMFLKTSTKM